MAEMWVGWMVESSAAWKELSMAEMMVV